MILVLIEHQNGQLKDINFELLTLAHTLAGPQKEEIYSLILSDDPKRYYEALKPFSHKIIAVENPAFKEFNNLYYYNCLRKFIDELKPRLIIIGHTGQGVDLAPYLATSLRIPLITDIFAAEFKEDKIFAHHAMFGGKINALLITQSLPAMITVRQGSFEKINAPGEFFLPLSAALEKISFTIETEILTRAKFLDYGTVPTSGIDITKADVIVAVGRGIKEEKNLALIEEFAREIGGTVACTRPIIDAGWLPKDRQVGSSGKTVKPKLYIALGISGAFQHISGMKSSETIIAVNKDPEAPIFSVAHYGVVGDLFKILPSLKNRLKELKG
jgi:electron transfer flavoprotein alpha subunit